MSVFFDPRDRIIRLIWVNSYYLYEYFNKLIILIPFNNLFKYFNNLVYYFFLKTIR